MQAAEFRALAEANRQQQLNPSISNAEKVSKIKAAADKAVVDLEAIDVKLSAVQDEARNQLLENVCVQTLV